MTKSDFRAEIFWLTDGFRILSMGNFICECSRHPRSPTLHKNSSYLNIFVVENEFHLYPSFKTNNSKSWSEVAPGVAFWKNGKSFAIGTDVSVVIDGHSRAAATAIFDVFVKLC